MESTLSVTRSELERIVAEHAGFAIFDTDDEPVTVWSNKEQYRINESLDGCIGLIAESGYDFSWLKPVALITLASGANTVDLPDDFNYIVGEVIPYESGTSRFRFPIRSAGDVYALESETTSQTGRPQVGCVDAIRGVSTNQSNRFQLRVFPTADQEYPLRIQYSLLQSKMTTSFPYAYGCGQHPQLLKAAAIAAYEMRYDKPNMDYQQTFQLMLQAAIMTDKRRKPSNAGCNTDTSDEYEYQKVRSFGSISINGVIPA